MRTGHGSLLMSTKGSDCPTPDAGKTEAASRATGCKAAVKTLSLVGISEKAPFFVWFAESGQFGQLSCLISFFEHRDLIGLLVFAGKWAECLTQATLFSFLVSIAPQKAHELRRKKRIHQQLPKKTTGAVQTQC